MSPTVQGDATAVLDRAAPAALGLSALGGVAALALSFPQHLTTPEFGAAFRSPWMAALVLCGLGAAVVLAMASLLRPTSCAAERRVGWYSLGLAAAGALLLAFSPQGGATASTTNATAYLGLDWLLIDLLACAALFIALERRFALRPDQPVFRPEWRTDLAYFCINHLAVGLVMLLANALAHGLQRGLNWGLNDGLMTTAAALPWWAAVPLILLIADLVQYWLHRAYHAVPLLWRLHRVHHSVRTMDWLAGSRQHLLELVATRCLGLAPILALGFEQSAVDAAIVIAMLQAVLNHANVNWPRKGSRLAWLSFLVVTPHFHHWHHAQDLQGRNFAALFSLLDHIFGTAHQRPGQWPVRYGLDEPAGHGAQANRTIKTGA